MHVPGATGRKKSSVVDLHVGLCAVLLVIRRLYLRHNTAPVVIRSNDTIVIVLYSVLHNGLGHYSHTMVADE